MDNLYGINFINMMKYAINNIKVVSGGSELLCRCPFCGDSRDIKHAHFYISVPKDYNELSFYSCKKCPAKGVVDDELLRKFKCNDASLLVQLSKHNSDIFKLPKYKTLKNINILPIQCNYIRDDKNNIEKLKYINDRIGSDFSISDIINLKIILNLYDLLNNNRLTLTRHKMIGDSLDKYFIGFLSYDNSFINMRKVTDKELYPAINKRYINYNVIDKLDNSKNYYIIPTNIDILNPDPVQIHIAEGPFDILSVYYNLNKCNNYQNIYISCGGKGYINSLEFILTELGIINFNIHYYPDKDIPDNYSYDNVSVSDIINKLSGFETTVYIHRNTYEGEKDFGVPMNRIKETVRCIRLGDYYG